jgi:hypothetical protein
MGTWLINTISFLFDIFIRIESDIDLVIIVLDLYSDKLWDNKSTVKRFVFLVLYTPFFLSDVNRFSLTQSYIIKGLDKKKKKKKNESERKKYYYK